MVLQPLFLRRLPFRQLFSYLPFSAFLRFRLLLRRPPVLRFPRRPRPPPVLPQRLRFLPPRFQWSFLIRLVLQSSFLAFSYFNLFHFGLFRFTFFLLNQCKHAR